MDFEKDTCTKGLYQMVAERWRKRMMWDVAGAHSQLPQKMKRSRVWVFAAVEVLPDLADSEHHVKRLEWQGVARWQRY